MRSYLSAPARLVILAAALFALSALTARSGHAGYSPETSKLDKLQGFRELVFGDAPPSAMVLAENDGALKFYHRASDNLTLGKATLTEIIYGYYKNQFFIAIMKAKGKKNGRAILDVFNDEYGTPNQPNATLQRYAWSGKVNSASFSEDAANGDVKAAIVNNAINAQQDADAAGGQ